MTRRKAGQASIEEHPKGSGRFRVRARVGGKLKTLATGVTEPEAKEIGSAYSVVRNESVLREGLTLKQFGAGFLDRREAEGVRGIRTERNNWKNHVESDPIAELPLATLERSDVLEWLDRRKGATQSRRNFLNLLRAALGQALDRNLISSNPSRDVRVRKTGKGNDRDDLAGIMTPAEQHRLLAAVPESSRALVAFALLTGVRQAEQWWLHPADIQGGVMVVRRSVGGEAPKNGKVRTVHLFQPARHALELAPSTDGLVWPAARGGRRAQGKAPKGWHKWVKAAKLGRRVRWHDLRHTCATALLAGWWGGRKWSLDEVCQHLGHSSVKVTERYARKLADTHRLAVNETVFPESSPLMLTGLEKQPKTRSRLRDLNSRPAVYETAPLASDPKRMSGGVFPRGNVEGVPGAWALCLAAEAVLRPLASARAAESAGVARGAQ